MNGLFLTQSRGLMAFYDLMTALREPLKLDRTGFLISYYPYYRQFRERVPDIDSDGYTLLKEWEVTASAANRRPDLSVITAYEQKLGNPNLWGPLVADRRVYFGRRSTYFQDYRPRFSHDQMLSLLEAGLVATERLFDDVRPDFVASFVCVTYLEYLAYLFARSRGIAFLNLRPTRIKNYVTYGESIFEPSERVRDAYHGFGAGRGDPKWMDEARRYVRQIQEGEALYEGVVPPGRRRSFSFSKWPRGLVNLVGGELRKRVDGVADNHDPGVLKPFVYRRVLNPVRARMTRRRIGSAYATEQDLASLDYVFFPLHTEPENTMQVFSTPYLNQIEVVRNLSHSLPVGMTVVVKEHPNAVGKRPWSYYRNLLKIPNVLLANPSMPSRPLVANARIVATIAGSVGWEAVLRRKPVVTFGHTPYEFLPDSMVRRVVDLERLGFEIADLTENYEYLEEAATAYVAAIMSQSAPVNWYTTLLGRSAGYTSGRDAPESAVAWQEDVDRLARYTVDSLSI